MINVFYWPREQRLVMHGHASNIRGGYSPVVCGAASALFYALCTTTDGFLKYKLVKGRYHLDEKGIGYCKIWPKRRFFKRTRVAIGMCVAGVMMLEEKHPDLVHVEVMNAWNHTSNGNFNDKKVLEEISAGGLSYLEKFVYDNTKDRPLITPGATPAEAPVSRHNSKNCTRSVRQEADAMNGQKGEKNEKA